MPLVHKLVIVLLLLYGTKPSFETKPAFKNEVGSCMMVHASNPSIRKPEAGE